MAARAKRVTAEAEIAKALGLLFSRYPEQQGAPMQMPAPEQIAVFKLTPVVISVLDYTKGFAHSDLVTV